MTRNEAKALLPIIQAYAEGKVIQFKLNGQWVNTDAPTFAGPIDEYRIKPEPREWWINVYQSGNRYVHDNKAEADAIVAGRNDCIHVREVVE